jgi:hypothetical protein
LRNAEKLKPEPKESVRIVRLKSLEKNKWEYSHAVITKIASLSETLNERDKEGWEVFTITSHRVGTILVIYRKKK